jgi:flagellar basal body-associated protein FliL
MKREYIIVLVIIAVIGVGGYLFITNTKNTINSATNTSTTQTNSVEQVTIPTQNVKVSLPKAQNSNLDTQQLENEINNLDLEDTSELDVDIE